MNRGSPREFALELKIIAEHLELCEQVTRYDGPEEKEAWTLAHDFLDLAESFRKFLEDELPKLKSAELNPDQRYESLLSIGEEFRHILYHIRNSKFYSYLEETERH